MEKGGLGSTFETLLLLVTEGRCAGQVDSAHRHYENLRRADTACSIWFNETYEIVAAKGMHLPCSY